MKKLIAIIFLGVALFMGWHHFCPPKNSIESAGDTTTTLYNAFKERRSGFQSEGGGVVIRVLSDDNDGSRHQRFILKLESGQTLLIAHNIDLAPRLSGLKNGDAVAFSGEYEWNSKGGLIHWTHHDPNGRHTPGWLKYKGRVYQ